MHTKIKPYIIAVVTAIFLLQSGFVFAQASGKKDVQSKKKQKLMALAKKQNRHKAERIYDEAAALYKAKRYAGARDKLDALREILLKRDFDSKILTSMNRKMTRLLEKIRKGEEKYKKQVKRREKKKKSEMAMNKIKRTKEAEEVQKEKVTKKPQMKKKDREAYKREQEMKKKEHMKRLAIRQQANLEHKVKKRQHDLKTERQKIAKDLNMRVDNLYNRAVKLHKEERFAQAKDLFKEISLLEPDYKSTESYLTRMDTDVKKRTKKRTSLKQKKRDRQKIIDEALDRMSR